MSKDGLRNAMFSRRPTMKWGVLKVGCVNQDRFDESQNKRLPAGLEPIPELEVRDGDVLVSRANTRELLGLAALAVMPRRKLLLCDKLFRFRLIPGRGEPRFVVLALRGKTSRTQIESSTNGASDSMQNIGQAVVRNLQVALPPVTEQLRIVGVLEGETAAQSAAVDQARREISFLREFRTRLIVDVVTGKLDVRDAAARLLDEPEEPEPPDDTEALAKGDEEGADLEAIPEAAEA